VCGGLRRIKQSEERRAAQQTAKVREADSVRNWCGRRCVSIRASEVKIHIDFSSKLLAADTTLPDVPPYVLLQRFLPSEEAAGGQQSTGVRDERSLSQNITLNNGCSFSR
jgi:hypothetical protein